MKIVRHDYPLGQYAEVSDLALTREGHCPISLKLGRTASYEVLSIVLTPQMARELGNLLIEFADEKESNGDQT